MDNICEGLIVRALGGFYYVEAADGKEYECRAKGIFRKNGISPVVGDKVKVEIDTQGLCMVSGIMPRKNEILRPPMANLDKLFIVTSICEPLPSTEIIDKLIAISEYKEIEPIIIITKSDLASTDELERIYINAGFTVKTVSNKHFFPTEDIKEILRNSICAFTGNTGVGKSSFLNSLYPELNIKTAQISKKLGRGKHTTRHVQLYKLEDINAYVADTPGFSTIDVDRYDIILKENLQFCFREFKPYIDKCKFSGCSHTVEKGCAVLEALSEGKIETSRHKSYVALYNNAKNIKEWELKK